MAQLERRAGAKSLTRQVFGIRIPPLHVLRERAGETANYPRTAGLALDSATETKDAETKGDVNL
jgi:hypothetical protein